MWNCVSFIVRLRPIACQIFEKSSTSCASTTDVWNSGSPNRFWWTSWKGTSLPITLRLSTKKKTLSRSLAPCVAHRWL